MLADPTQIHQLAMNLITNAFHALQGDGGILTVGLCEADLEEDALPSPTLKPGPYVRLSISDTGCGMDAACMEKIFQPYFTTKGREKGTGLGLAVVHGIVQSCQGAIVVQSEPGKGSAFEVYLPRIASQSDALSAMEKDRQAPGGAERILLVDDEESVTAIMGRLLKRLGYAVQTANSAQEAREIFEKDPAGFDLVITDLTMPKMMGDKLAREFKRIRPEIPIILCTGYSESLDQEKVQSMGIQGLLFKPVIKDDLARAIRSALDG